MKAITNHYYCARDKMQSAFKIIIKKTNLWKTMN